jgi:hypothetical protein
MTTLEAGLLQWGTRYAFVMGMLLSATAVQAACIPNGDDAGCFTTNATYSSCEQRAMKKASTLVQALLKCHLKAAAAAVKGTTFVEEACEGAARAKFQLRTATDDCPCVYTAGIATDVERIVDQDLNGALFCMEACPAGAASVGGRCWVHGAPGEDCNTGCATIGQACDVATTTYAGSDGTDANCSAVGTALGPGGALGVPSCPEGVGCVSAGGVAARCEAPPTTCEAAIAGSARFCACH